ncbi:ABC-type dipeptide transport system, periplasmic component [Burkholderiales bacterium JOSHI_001]|nr:ABC-type dipeptide transport system, periplasmic component [Burkholderiales bacterium JOSHI_001]
MTHGPVSLRRRGALVALAAGPAALAAPLAADDDGSAGRRLLRLAFRNAETSFDPVKVTDTYSATVLSHIFEAPYTYDHLARPFRIRPLTADGMPQVSVDFKTWTLRLKPGTFFADDPAFKGRRRELVAQDYVYALQRALDPRNNCPWVSDLLQTKIAGMAQAWNQAKAAGRLDYDQPIPGLQVLGRHELRIVCTEPRPGLLTELARSALRGAQAREVVEHYGEAIAEHPVGTGPFQLKAWQRSSRIVLVRNPGYREHLYDAQPAADDAEGQALAARLKGRRLPMVDEVQISIIPEEQPLWLSFLRQDIDGLLTIAGGLPITAAPLAVPGGKLAPFLAQRGVQMRRQVNADVVITYFNMEHPVVGGYTPDKVALRRAIALAYDNEREIRLVRRGQAVPAQSYVLPHCSGYDPAFKSEMSDHDPARARALLDLYGYVDRDGDGWREMPDGSPLKLVMATEPQAIYREFNEMWHKSLTTVGIRCDFATAQWAENMKGAHAGRHMMWGLGNTATSPDGADGLARMHGPQSGNENLARFQDPRFDRLYERIIALPDGPERNALFAQAKRFEVAYMPYKSHVHRISTDLAHPWVIGFRRPQFWNEWWHMVDVDLALRQRHLKT